MPKPCDSTFFAIVCEDREFSRHIRVCDNSGFSVVRDKPLGRVTVVDGSAIWIDENKDITYWEIPRRGTMKFD